MRWSLEDTVGCRLPFHTSKTKPQLVHNIVVSPVENRNYSLTHGVLVGRWFFLNLLNVHLQETAYLYTDLLRLLVHHRERWQRAYSLILRAAGYLFWAIPWYLQTASSLYSSLYSTVKRITRNLYSDNTHPHAAELTAFINHLTSAPSKRPVVRAWQSVYDCQHVPLFCSFSSNSSSICPNGTEELCVTSCDRDYLRSPYDQCEIHVQC